MAMGIGTPVNQIRLTNVAYVRLQKGGKRFELACYRNKVLNWRNKIETDLDEVLQIDTVFTNVSKGNLASSKDLLEAFGTSDQKAVCKEILDKGELQVSEQERGAQLEGIFKDIASIVADKTVNPENNRPYTISMIQNAMKQIHYSVNTTKNAKSQALEVIRKLRDVMPIARATMLLRIICPSSMMGEMKRYLQEELGLNLSLWLTPEAQSGDGVEKGAGDGSDKNAYLDLKVDPELFRKVEEAVTSMTNGIGRLEVLQLRVASSAGVQTNSTAGLQTNSTGGAGITSLLGPSAIKEKTEKIETSVSSVKTEIHNPIGMVVKEKKKKKEKKEKTGKITGGRGEEEEEDDAVVASVFRRGLDTSLVLEEGNEDSDNSDEGEDEGAVVGMVTKKSKKKSKGIISQDKNLIQSPSPTASDSDDSDDDFDVSLTPQHVVSHTGGPNTNGPHTSDRGPAPTANKDKDKEKEKENGNRKGKYTKRMEKEKQTERELKAVDMKRRIDLEQVRVVNNKVDGDPVAVEVGGGTTGGGLKCNTCGGSFDAVAYRSHFRSEWHRHNLSRKLRNPTLLPIPSEDAFKNLTIDQLEIEDLRI
mmetsp:Transcript_19499/g.18829  ORF Transcript_19499/g.18829 Transcript_19499/m.18829 type:complete len:589 (+) Transcript_19499:127-1893(+)|eukprot:CAMPEP_0119034064 /NCGR_PEP_ID=MMETSP1177-20130426/1112_1 /TAXON_ID=2985 /ORGANISM="Ochromonas sp, Strain CCMP1899" /LENGTH=588 /DNA_ID=CAMNT_0006991273 /DNA_START=127 /DNA_END=1893 /DNA_ORIENTATION=-